MTPDEACDVVDRYIGNAKEEMLRRYDLALREIALLRPWQIGKSQQIACKVMGIGPYWRCDGRPRTFLGFWLAQWRIDVASRWRIFLYRGGIAECLRCFATWRYNLGRPADRRVTISYQLPRYSMFPAAYWFFLTIGLLLIGAGVLLIMHGPQNLAAGIATEIIAFGMIFGGVVSVLAQVAIWLFALAGGKR